MKLRSGTRLPPTSEQYTIQTYISRQELANTLMTHLNHIEAQEATVVIDKTSLLKAVDAYTPMFEFIHQFKWDIWMYGQKYEPICRFIDAIQSKSQYLYANFGRTFLRYHREEGIEFDKKEVRMVMRLLNMLNQTYSYYEKMKRI